jgi:hypothetical protein
MESSVVGIKGMNMQKKCENKDNINGAGKGGVIGEGGNVVNDTDEMTKIDKIQQDALTKNKILDFINAEEYARALESCKENNSLPSILLTEEVVASVRCNV